MTRNNGNLRDILSRPDAASSLLPFPFVDLFSHFINVLLIILNGWSDFARLATDRKHGHG